MRIQYKLTLVEVVITLGFTVAIGVSLYFTNFAVTLKNLEYKVSAVFSSMEKLNYSTKTFLSTAKSITDLRADLQKDVDDFEDKLNILTEDKGIKILAKKTVKNYTEVIGWWKQLKDWHLDPELKMLDEMIEEGYTDRIGDGGILQAYHANENENIQLFSKVHSLMNYQDNFLDNSELFIDKLDVFLKGITTEAESILKFNYWMVIGIVVLTVLFSIFVVNVIAWRISMRIRLVEDAIKTVSEGDFSRDLIIKSGDEFEELSNHYNAFKTELWKKLDSVLGFMIDISVSLSEGLDIDLALEKVLHSIVQNSSADAGAVFMIDSESSSIQLKAVEGPFPCPFEVPEAVRVTIGRQLDFLKGHKIPLGKTIIGASIKSGEGIFIKDSEKSEFLKANSSKESLQYIRSMAVVPLVITRRVLGAIALVKTNNEEAFTDVDFTNMKTFGDYAALTIDNLYNFTEAVQKTEMERELKIAANIQRKLLPQNLPEIVNFTIGVFSQAAETVSSDYYDVFKLSKDKTAVVICDVVGKGVPASLLMVMIRTMIRLVASSAKDSDHLLRIINKGLRKKIGVDQYATMGVLFIGEKNRKITYSNAAHSPLLYFNAMENQFRQIDTPGLPIGVEPDEKYSKEVIIPSKGDLLIIYTDGVMEARNKQGKIYSLKRLQTVISGNADNSADKITEAVLQDITAFTGTAKKIDDQTLLILKSN